MNSSDLGEAMVRVKTWGDIEEVMLRLASELEDLPEVPWAPHLAGRLGELKVDVRFVANTPWARGPASVYLTPVKNSLSDLVSGVAGIKVVKSEQAAESAVAKIERGVARIVYEQGGLMALLWQRGGGEGERAQDWLHDAAGDAS